MKSAIMKKILSLLTVFALIAAIALTFTACGGKEKAETSGAEVTITVDIVDDEGNTKTYDITTAGTTLYDALTQESLVEGEEGAYGLYIKSVNGLVADYDVNGAYWGLFKDGEYLMTGVSDTIIAEGEHYEIVYTVG